MVRRRLRKAARRKRLSDWRVLYFSGHHGWLSKLKFTLLRSSATTTATMTTMARQEPRDLPLTILLYRQDSFARCLKITEKVLFNIASEASYVYILSGQKFIKKCQKWWWSEVYDQTALPDMSILKGQKIGGKCQKWDRLSNFQTMWNGHSFVMLTIYTPIA